MKITMGIVMASMLILIPKSVIQSVNEETANDMKNNQTIREMYAEFHITSVSDFWCQSQIPSDAYKYASPSDLQKLQEYYHGNGNQPISPFICTLIRWLEE